MKSASLSIGDFIDVTTDRLAYGGEAVAHHDGLVIFIPFAAPAERVRVQITERKKNFARAVIDRVLEPSPARRVAPCKYFGECGGCQLQHLDYRTQLEAKAGFVRDALERIGRIDWPREIPILHGEEFAYRGRAQINIDAKSGRVGFKRAMSNAVCDVESCPILVPELDQALASIRAALAADREFARPSQVDLASGDSGVSSAPSIAGLPEKDLQRTAGGAVYNFGASAFFQVNPGLLDKLIDEALGEASGELAVDLYAGVGLFTVQLARRFKRVVGVESDAGAVRYAIRNLTVNNVTNVAFEHAAVESWLKRAAATEAPPPDLVLLDPPRTGAAAAIPHIAALKPARITYVSCDPATLARDLRGLIDSGYELLRVLAIDLFPQTFHVEAIASLARHG